MISKRALFYSHLAQTSPAPMGLEVERAKGIYLYDSQGKAYIDLIAGISVSNVGHGHPKVQEAVKNQIDLYAHLMVYGEYIQGPQVELAQLITSLLPPQLDNVYFVNSGSEANEGAMKLAKRYTGRGKLVYCKNAYHGSTQGTLSIIGDEKFKKPFEPLLPGTVEMHFNQEEDLALITDEVAAVILEPIQAEAGIIVPAHDYLKKLRRRCTEVGALLIFDEVQTGFGRTGKMFGFEQFGVIPDIMTLAKGMGGGMPIGAFIASRDMMQCLTHDPVLGHITTFGGHPVSCAASKACIEVLLEGQLVQEVEPKGRLFMDRLDHPLIKEKRGIGLLTGLDLGTQDLNFKVIAKCIEKGVITDWFLFNDSTLRIAPPLTISEQEVIKACELILEALDEIS